MGAILSPWSPHLARKFLYIIAAIILLVLAAGVVYQLFPGWIARTAFVPSTAFKPQAAVAPNAYDDPDMWFARPGLENTPSAWRPAADGREPPGTDRKSTRLNPTQLCTTH